MEFGEFFKDIFYALGSLVVVWIGYSFSEVKASLRELTSSVTELNVKMATIIEKTDSHERRISRLEDKE